MSGCLQINAQKWNLCGSDGMKLFLPRARGDRFVYYQTDWSFVPSDVDAARAPAEQPKLRLRLIGCVPGLRDWRDLENLFLGCHEPIDGKETPEDARGPDIWIWPPGVTSPLRFGHWETDLKFGERHGREFGISLEAIILSERASQFRMDYQVKQFFRQPVPPDWELPEWVGEVDDKLSFEGSVEFREIFCSAPLNGSQPVEWARRLARRELAQDEFGPGSVHEKDCPGRFKVSDVSATGRVVVLPMPAG